MPWGCVSGERLAERAFKVASPPDPHYGSESLRIFHIFRRAKSRFVSLLFSAHRGLLPSKFNHFSSNAHRLMPAYLFGTVVTAHPATAQLPQLCQSRRCTYSAHTFKFPPCRPQWAGARRTNDSGFARRNLLAIFQEGVSRNRSPGQAAYERPLREGAHRRRPPAGLWFLSDRSERNPPRRAEPPQ